MTATMSRGVRKITLEVELGDGGCVYLEGVPREGVQMTLTPHYSSGPYAVIDTVGVTMQMVVEALRYREEPPQREPRALTSETKRVDFGAPPDGRTPFYGGRDEDGM